jgi:hypothetical protein
MYPLALVILATLALSQLAQAQSSYAGMQNRPIKALSDDQVADLKAGRGMGLALAAELNGYPGPSHVLELADKLELSAEQRNRVQQLFDSMKAEAVPLGTVLLAQEAALDKAWASRSITPESLKSAVEEIGVTQAALRNAHLKYHLQTVQILSADQTKRYSSLRGYDSGVPVHRHRH